MKLIKRADMTYGWWVSPEAKVHPVEDFAHADFVEKHPELFGTLFGDKSSYRSEALDKGWIRVVGEKDSLSFHMPSSDKKYLITVQKVLDELPIVKTIYVDAGDYHLLVPFWEFVECKSFDDLSKYKVATARPISKRVGLAK